MADTQKFDLHGNPYACGEKMSKRQYYSHAGPGWDYRFSQPEYDWNTDQVDSDVPWPPEGEKR